MKPHGIEELGDYARLAMTEGVGPVAFRRLLGQFGSPEAAIEALPRLARAGGRAAPPVIPARRDVAKELESLRRMGGRLLVLGQPGYPRLLALLEDAPPLLFVLGDPAALDARAVALVGGRNASANGQKMAETLATELAAAGLVEVSGLARGIDAAAHRGALSSGTTIAAVAGGLDVPYPPENRALQDAIAKGGAVVTEARLGTEPQSRHFPRRNRIIAGLSLGVVVVEAALRSGSLITARIAQDAGRELFAVPGSPLDPRARGSNDLIRQGAHLTESATDVMDNLPDHPMQEGLGRDPLFRHVGVGFSEPRQPADWVAPAVEQEVGWARASLTDLLGPDPVAVDDLVRRCQLSLSAVMAALLELELAGRIEHLPGSRVALLL